MRFHVVDTFADESFAGNPAAVVVAEAFPAEAAMQREAHRIGLPTTAFVVPAVAPEEYRVRWFTPYKEINLCGHATIASARHLFDRDTGLKRLTFVSDNGVLRAERDGDLVAIELQAVPPAPCEPPAGLLEALGTAAARCAVSSDDILVEVESAQAVAAVRPDFAALAAQPFRGHIVTARASSDVDFVSRTFFPALGVNEDQVCVSAHCKLAPYWAERLGRTRLTALQLSQRGGRLEMTLAGERVRVLGTAVPR
ncbi:PhzF family phenazine biosynthesis protein [Streptosporangium becharense]|uniref:PhzF family phenazine biosynthesis protein n=1 Tax=Streptosporangium becharense TaxID=1816182 RepID=A0A7W9IBE0_9ACTN|nr:PhzF family phenazine biosynthesis protein [Streptosporangium becharense]MBB2914104.1 PhzF family phenazine biosynthesis protein [Streptosporangium becharense]MBB5817131.1 PhzF family phenazine biosynthesis protein [Streptosporangium becharense]